jgi:glycosyltransferase involved in cell wall biosynthesis
MVLCPMKILMVAPQPFLESRGTPLSILGRLKALSELGHEVDLLTYSVGQNVSIPKVVIHRTPHIRFIRTVKVGPSLTKLFLDILLFIKAFRLLQKGRYDLLHSHEEASFFGILLARLFKVRHLYDMHSSLPQQLGNFQYTNSRVLIRLFEWLEYQAIHASDAVITVCPALEEQVKKVNGYIPHVMIENVASGGDPGAVSEEEVEKFQVAHSLAGKRIILYAGTFEPYQGLDLLVASAEQVIHRYKDAVFLLIGGNPSQVHSYQTRVKELGLSPYFRFIGMRPPEEIPPAIRLAHILVSPRINGTNTPLKIYGYLQSGKPIVATNIYTHTQVLSADVAVLVEPNPEALARGILTVLENPCLAAKLGAQARQMFEDHYGFPTFLQKTAQALQMALR